MTSLNVAEELHAKYGGCMEKMLRDVLKVRDADVLARKAAELLDCEPASLASKKTPAQWEPVVKKLISWKMIDRGMMKQAKIDDCIKAEQIASNKWSVEVDDGLMKEMASLYGEMMGEAAGSSASNVVEAMSSAFVGFSESVKRELQNMPKKRDERAKLKDRHNAMATAVSKAKSMKLGPRAAALVNQVTPELHNLAEGIKKLESLKLEDALKKSESDASALKNDELSTREERAEKLKQITQGADAALSEYEELYKSLSEKCDALEKKLAPLVNAMRSRA